MTDNKILIHLHNDEIIIIPGTGALLKKCIDLQSHPSVSCGLGGIYSFVQNVGMIHYNIDRRFIKKITWEFNIEWISSEFERTGVLEFSVFEKNLPVLISYHVDKLNE